MKGRRIIICVGTDTHRGSHALAAVDEGTGRVRGQREIKADEPWASGCGQMGSWAR